jgi:hypothetical protein
MGILAALTFMTDRASKGPTRAATGHGMRRNLGTGTVAAAGIRHGLMRLHVFAVGPGPASGEPLLHAHRGQHLGVAAALTFMTDRASKGPTRAATGHGMRRNGLAEAGRRNAEVLAAMGMQERLAALWMTSQAPSASTPDCRAMRNTLEPAP